MASVLVKVGEYRNQPVINKQFTLVKGLQLGKKGNYITVKNDGQFPNVDIDQVRVRVSNKDAIEIEGFVGSEEDILGSTQNSAATANKIQETDAQAMDRIATRFKILDEMALACTNGGIRSLVVSGPPGVGKSFGVEQQLEKSSMFDQLADSRIRHTVVKGACTALGLFIQLYNYSNAKDVIVFDDSDSIWGDELALNLLKAALDSGKKRKICWNSDSRLLREEMIPNSFDFKGSIIFITNLKFENVRSKRMQDHIEALMSRCHYLDLTIDTMRDRLLRIRQVHRDAEGGLFKDYDFENGEGEQVFDFIDQNTARLRELSIRMALKIADLIKISPNNWRALAESTCMRH